MTVTSGDDQRVKRFLQALYYGALQADAPSQWMTDKTNELAAAGAQSQAQLLVKAKEIARALFVQTTYETNPSKSDTQYVTDLYYAYLQRGPDASGLGWWVGQAAGSVQNRINVCNAFEASGEFLTLVNTLYGTATSDSQRTENYVTNFYQGALARPPDSNELATNSATLNNAAGQGQSQVISAAETFGRSLFAAQVNDASLSNTQYVTNLYEGFLQRGPDASGLSFWSGLASVGSGRQNVLTAFATSSAFRELAGTLYREASWLVADHLGTPRMVVNKSGSLASVKRHDYLPFGEELYAGTGGRTTGQGYSGDSVRQKFTSKERDTETGLDYFGARYYASTQGRFQSIDPYNINFERQQSEDPGEAEKEFSRYISQPQHWNHYSYVLNNPLKFIDPDGWSEADTFTANLLGQEVTIILDKKILKKDPDALAKVKEAITKAFDKINQALNDKPFTKEQLDSIHRLDKIQVTPNKTGAEGMGGNTFYLQFNHAANPNTDILSGDIMHDARHGEQAARGISYNEKTAIPMEMEASNFVLGIIVTRGWSDSSIQSFCADSVKGHLKPFSKWKDKSTPQSRQKLFDRMRAPVTK